MVCLDTNFIIDLIRKQKEAIQKLSEIDTAKTRICTTAITALELYKGAYKFQKTEKVKEIDDILDSMEILPLTHQASKIFGELSNNDIIKSNYPGDRDLMMACIAVSDREPILTRNIQHFDKIPDLKVETW